MTNEQIERIAKAYADSLKMLLTREEWATMRKRNATPEYETFDAAADFLDNEQLLIDASEAVLGREIDFETEEHLSGICDAHNLALNKYLTERA